MGTSVHRLRRRCRCGDASPRTGVLGGVRCRDCDRGRFLVRNRQGFVISESFRAAIGFFRRCNVRVFGNCGSLKGAAIKTLGLNRAHFVGAASVVSLVGDLTKAAVYSKASLLVPENWGIVAAAVPLMMGAALLGRKINRSIGERAYNTMFWGVMVGYSIRLLLA